MHRSHYVNITHSLCFNIIFVGRLKRSFSKERLQTVQNPTWSSKKAMVERYGHLSTGNILGWTNLQTNNFQQNSGVRLPYFPFENMGKLYFYERKKKNQLLTKKRFKKKYMIEHPKDVTCQRELWLRSSHTGCFGSEAPTWEGCQGPISRRGQELLVFLNSTRYCLMQHS